MWTVLATKEFGEWFAEDATEQARSAIYAEIERLRVLGPLLSRPHADTLSGSAHSNMKELRVTAPGAEIRIAFAFDPDRAAILLCAASKSGVNQHRFYKTLIAKADRLFDEHLASIASRRAKTMKNDRGRKGKRKD